MQTYPGKAALIAEIELHAKRFCDEFQTVAEADKDLLLESVERTPAQMLAYQIGWMQLIQQWEAANWQGVDVATPHPDYRWNQLGALYQYFYERYAQQSLAALRQQFAENVAAIIALIESLDEDALFTPGNGNGHRPHPRIGRYGNGCISIPSHHAKPFAVKSVNGRKSDKEYHHEQFAISRWLRNCLYCPHASRGNMQPA